MLEFFSKLKSGDNSINQLKNYIRQGIPSAVFGVTESAKSLITASIEEKVVLVVKDGLTAKKFKEQLEQLSSESVGAIIAREENLTYARAFSKDLTFDRISQLKDLNKRRINIVTIDALMQLVPKKIDGLILDKQKETNLELAVKKLISLGYRRVDSVESKGSFSLRGDILDVFAINQDMPVRIDFFGDDIESIKLIDIESRKTIKTLDCVQILQASEFIFSSQDISRIKESIRNELINCEKSAKDRLREIADDAYVAIESNDLDLLQNFAPLSEYADRLFEQFDQNAVLILDEPKKLYDYAELVYKEFNERFNSLYKSGEAFSFTNKALLPLQTLSQFMHGFRLACVQTLTTAVPFFSPLKIVNPEVGGIINYQLNFEELFTDIDNWLYGGYDIAIFTGDNKRSNTLNFELSVRGVASALNPKTLQGVCVYDYNLSSGFIFHEEKLVVIGSANLYRQTSEIKKKVPKKASFFTAPETGDYCVHELHGVGKVLGTNRISTTEGTKDYITIEYSGGDILHIPVEQLDILTRYLGAEKHPRLSKIGGADFERIKRAVKESIKKMSFDLKKLYKEREAKVGYAFTEFDDLEKEFAKDFAYEETPDQLTAGKAIKEDMLSSIVMDRLVCGDVGFGKTEVAFKACFRAIANGKQVALLAPTTILTEQHYNTAKERFKRFGVKIACLNRFRTAKQVKNILDKLKDGEIDFIIGTHRLLGKDIEFKDLGLLILDEEQRFGVEHKEKIKLLKNNVDTLTLTATPIPRTLHMSLSGIRPISVITTPPKKRLPVQIYVTEETDALIKDAITKEINRGGQAFILYNRVESIFTFAERISKLLPNVKFATAHGRMEEKLLENRVIDFYNGKYDVLISTTIIENGIDLPKANTLIVIDADRLGLSSLYQLKGRVGRSDRLAYAYFTFKRDKVLTQTAYERLNTIIEFTEMGSGIKVAMRDLEIRGAGNILGAEQHGHMDKVGYELYSKLLREEMSGNEEIVPELDLRISAYIPEEYIESNSSRMSVYKEIAEIENQADATEIKEYLTDTYGKIPKETLNLIEISIIKRLAMKLSATKIEVSKQKIALSFANFNAFKNQNLFSTIEENKQLVRISMQESPSLEFNRIKQTNVEMLEEVKKFLFKAIN